MKAKTAFALIVLCISIPAMAIGTSAAKHLADQDDWYKSDEAKKMADNILSWEAPTGGWPKNIDTAIELNKDDPKTLHATYDNKATTDEVRFLAHMYSVTKDPRYLQPVLKGIDYILNGQYPNGGWPQSYPPDEKYDKYITFNDGSMARIMFFIKEVGHDPLYSVVDETRRGRCREAYERGVDCILKCQVKVDGKLTVWCAQHDEKDFSPRPARAFEPISLSGCESVGLAHVLMSIDNPSPQIVAAVDAAVAYLDSVKIQGIKIEDRPNKDSPKGYDRFVVEDPSAPLEWARFYEIGTNKPIFSDRDSVIKYSLAEIGAERRNGYKWYGVWPSNLIAKEYPAWKVKLASSATSPSK
jgi:PelA/Pel-15E family pectate lyase